LNLPFSVCSSVLRIPQPLCLPLLRKLPGCVPTIPNLERLLFPPSPFNRSSRIPRPGRNLALSTCVPFQLSPLFSNRCPLFCTILHSREIQLFSFKAIPHSFAKTQRFAGRSTFNLALVPVSHV